MWPTGPSLSGPNTACRGRGDQLQPMKSRSGLVAAICLAASVLPISNAGATAEPDVGDIEGAAEANVTANGVEVVRLWSPDRYGTSLAVARELVRLRGGRAEAVVLASGESWADAAVAGPLAASLSAPVLLVPPGGLQTSAARPDLVEFLRSAGTRRVVILGSPRCVAESRAVGAVRAGDAAPQHRTRHTATTRSRCRSRSRRESALPRSSRS